MDIYSQRGSKANLQYIAQDSVEYADLLIDKINDKAKILLNYSRLGRIVPEIELDEFRELIYQNYRIIYHLNENSIEIITILHTSRLFKI